LGARWVTENPCLTDVIRQRSLTPSGEASNFPFSALTLLVGDRKGIRPVKKLGVGLLVVTFDWRFARLIAAVVSPAPSPLAPIKSRRWILSGTG